MNAPVTKDDKRLNKKYIGVCIGSSSIKCTMLEDNEIKITRSKFHGSDIYTSLSELVHGLSNANTNMILTGTEGRTQFSYPEIIEPIAVESAIEYLKTHKNFTHDINAVVSLGGEDLIVYVINNKTGKIINNFSGDKCAAGTGEFFKQQLLRMDLTLDDVENEANDAKIVKLSSRCSVFMKSDCTHKLNKGEVSKGDIVRSLAHVMALKTSEFLLKGKIDKGTVLLIGGVTKNKFVLESLKMLLPDVNFIVPDYADTFESLGAAYYAYSNGVEEEFIGLEGKFNSDALSLETYEPLNKAEKLVNFINSERDSFKEGKEYIIGIDGGSTTTKIAVVDPDSKKIVFSHYGRTHGNPIAALKNCLELLNNELKKQHMHGKVKFNLAATTGSSREILGVFMQTPGVYNEIIAHSVGTTQYTDTIDTIFEIGGQDAKYVNLKNGVPVDYAMNEACSAGTGSFLEESCSSDLNIHSVEDIAPEALKGDRPLKFGEHCSAFINSDIRKSIQKGAKKPNIVAGLVYSIIHNYLNRVVGNRSIGENIVLQGGVAKNKAVALAFAMLLDKKITVPPDPELMGAYGVALLAQQKMNEGLISATSIVLEEVLSTIVETVKTFKCKACDNYCEIKVLKVGENRYNFGGRCGKFTTMKTMNNKEVQPVNYIDMRDELMFKKYASPQLEKSDLIVGIPYQFAVYSLWPFLSHFFGELGIKTILSEEYTDEGMRTTQAPFCFPGEVVHATMHNLIKNHDCDLYFLPHFFNMPTMEESTIATLCPVTQGMPYYLKIAFDLEDKQILKPLMSFADGNEKALVHFEELASQLKRSKDQIRKAFYKGIEKQEEFTKEIQEIGKKVLSDAEKNDELVIVLAGRPYNAYTKVVNMGIPKKFTSRNYTIIPMDFLPFQNEEITDHMYWYYGQQILKSAKLTRNNKNLFFCIISNFSCAPDSFILHYIKWIMGIKPFLVLELDSHTADAGVDTRVEAFLDIIDGYKRKLKDENTDIPVRRYKSTIIKGKPFILDNKTGEKIAFTDKRIKMIIPPMGDFPASLTASYIDSTGISCISLPTADRFTVQLAKNVASGKECIPTLLVLGSSLQFFQQNKMERDKIYCIFTPSTDGPCRTGQYATFYEQTFERMGWDNVITLTLSSENSYTELGSEFSKDVWRILALSDTMQDIETSLQLLAKDEKDAMAKLHKIYDDIIQIYKTSKKGKHFPTTIKYLEKAKSILNNIPLKDSLENLKKVLIVGEIYVRRDTFSVNQALDLLKKGNIYGKVTGITEWIHYTDFIRKNQLRREVRKNMAIATEGALKRQFKKNPFVATGKFVKGFFTSFSEFKDLSVLRIEEWWKHKQEKAISKVLNNKNLVPKYPHNMSKIVSYSNEYFFSADFETEATVSSGVAALSRDEGYHGAIAIAPFACLPGRLIKAAFEPYSRKLNYPFIALENDGDPYPPSIVNKMDIFMLNVNRQK